MKVHVHHGREKFTDVRVWDELSLEFKELQYLNITKDSIWNTARDREMDRPLTREELRQIQEGQNTKTIAKTRFWRMRPDVIVFRPPTETKAGVFCILEFKHMSVQQSDVTDQYLLRARF
jgi:hypothetical protein